MKKTQERKPIFFSKSGPKRRPDQTARFRLILMLVSYGYSDQRIRESMARSFPYRKQLASDDMRALTYHHGYLKDLDPFMNKNKKHELTESGRTVLDQFDKADKKISTSVENPRYMSLIKNKTLLMKFLAHKEFNFKSTPQLKNIIYYHGSIENYSVRVFLGREPSIEFTPQPTPVYGKDIERTRKIIQASVTDVCNRLNSAWNLDIIAPWAMKGKQYTVSDAFARGVMKTTNGEQIKFKTSSGLVDINASNGGEPRVEFEEIEQIREYLDMPKDLADLTVHIEKIINRMDNTQKAQEMQQYLLERLVIGEEKNAENIGKVSELLNKLFDNKSGPEQVAQRDLTNDTKRMFW